MTKWKHIHGKIQQKRKRKIKKEVEEEQSTPNGNQYKKEKKNKVMMYHTYFKTLCDVKLSSPERFISCNLS